MSNTLIVPQKLFEKLQIKKKRLLRNLSVKVVKETIQGIFIFNLAKKSRKTVNAQPAAVYCKDQRVNSLTATRTDLMLIRPHLRKLTIEVSELYVTFVWLI